MAWRLLDFRRHNIFENMAIDEAVFRETIIHNAQPTLRFYASDPAAVTMGYFQDAREEINIEKCREAGIDIARRITGGRAVFHSHELTYSVTATRQEEIFPADIAGTYKIISQCIARGLNDLGINAGLAKEGRAPGRAVKACCFSTPLQNELLVNGRKICGSAQVRKRGGFLQHGLLLLDFNPVKTADVLLPRCSSEQVLQLEQSVTSVHKELAQAIDTREICARIKKGFIEELGIRLEEGTLSPAEQKLKNELMEKYTDTDWNINRKKYFKVG